MIEDLSDPRRVEPPYLATERAMLEGWLEFHRTTLVLKCEGLDDAAAQGAARAQLEALAARLGPAHGGGGTELVPEGAAAESPTLAPIWYDPAVEDSELVPLDHADWDTDLAAWQAECEDSRAAAALRSLDDTGRRDGEPCSLRWIYTHMVEEYARHNGHADLIRELVDGSVGW